MSTPPSISLIYLAHCFAKDGNEGSLWLVPGRADDIEGDCHITDYLKARGILLRVLRSSLEEDLLVEEVKRKFTAQGFAIEYEVTADD